mgnify:CR=1 FL=1
MKRRMLALLLAVLMLAMLTAAAFAEDTVLGVYNVTGPLTVLNGTKNGSFYADANEFELNCSGLTGEYSLVLLLEGDSPVPTDGNIQYIDQMSIANGAVKFTLKPKALKVGTYNIYISTTDEALKKVASFKYGTKPAYTKGDANLDDEIDVNDAVHILRYAARLIDLSETELKAADANGDGVVDVNDAVMILRYLAKLITSF